MLAESKSILADLFRDNPHAIASYLTEQFQTNDIEQVRTALSLTTQAQNVQILARDAGIRRDTLYRTFGGKVDPQLSRILRLFSALNVHFQVMLSGEPEIPPQPDLSVATARKKVLARLFRNNQKLVVAYLNEAFERNDFQKAVLALSEVTHAQNVSELGRDAGIPRTTFYKTFGGKVDPQLSPILKLFAVLKLRFAVAPSPVTERPPRPKLGRPKKRPQQKGNETGGRERESER